MAKTLEQDLKDVLGGLIFQLSSANVQIANLTESNLALQVELAELSKKLVEHQEKTTGK